MEREQVERVLEEHGQRILHLAYSYLGSREDAEDILQDTLVRYMDKAPGFRSPEHEKAWLLRVAANLCKNRLKAPWRGALPGSDPPVLLRGRHHRRDRRHPGQAGGDRAVSALPGTGAASPELEGRAGP